MFPKAVYLSLLVLAFGLLAWLPAPQGDISVVTTSQETHFPDEVVFTLEASSKADILEVTFFYRIEGAPSVAYGYPTFTSGPQVKAEFSIKTGNGSYIPSGVDIEYRYVIKDSEGNQLETAPALFRYRDPRFTWHELTDGPLTVLWHGYSEDRVRDTVAEVRERLDSVSKVLGAELGRPLKAVLYNRSREAVSAFPQISETATREHIYVGFAFPNYNIFLLVGLTSDGMVHELTHLLLDQATDSPLVRVPAWLNEGLATYFEGYSQSRAGSVATAARRDKLLRLSSMGTIPGRPQDIRLFYDQAWSVVTYMMDTHGEGKIGQLLRSMNTGHSINQALQDTYGFTLNELEDAWKAKVIETPLPLTNRELSSFLLVGVLIAFFVLAISAWAYRRLRADRGIP